MSKAPENSFICQALRMRKGEKVGEETRGWFGAGLGLGQSPRVHGGGLAGRVLHNPSADPKVGPGEPEPPRT